MLRDQIARVRGIAIILMMLLVGPAIFAQPRKIIIDHDARGPATTDIQSILMFVQSPDVQVLGVTTVSGDQWVKEETLHALRALEIAGRTDIPVVMGAEYPLVNSKAEAEWWQERFGPLEYMGAWNALGYHSPDFIPEMPEGKPATQPLKESAADFIVRMVHRYPHEVTIWEGGPLTNIALAIRLDPEVPRLAKELVLMGSGFNGTTGGIGGVNARREFNWWFDPEAVHIVMHSPWKKITITPVDISVKTHLGKEIQDAIAKADTPVARYLTQFSRPSYMWDELSAAAWLDPTIITEQKEMRVDTDINHGASYGQTVFVEKDAKAPADWAVSAMQFDLNKEKFYKLYIDLMTRAPKKLAARK